MLPWRCQSRGVVHTPKAESPSRPSYLPCTSACCPRLPIQPSSLSVCPGRVLSLPWVLYFPPILQAPLELPAPPSRGTHRQPQSWVLTLTHSRSRACTGTHVLYTSTCTYTHAHHVHTHTSAPTRIEIHVQIHTHTLCTYTPMLQSPRRATLTHTLIPTQARGGR